MKASILLDWNAKVRNIKRKTRKFRDKWKNVLKKNVDNRVLIEEDSRHKLLPFI